MPVTSLGLFLPAFTPPRKPPSAPAATAVDDAFRIHRARPRMVRLIPFAACVGLAIWAFAVPVEAAEIITTIAADEQASQLQGLSAVLGGAAALNLTVPEFDLDAEYLQKVLTVFVRMFSTLILLASGGIPGGDVAGRACATLAHATATGFMVAIVVEDKYEILTEWFSFTYLFLGCALPTVVTSMETVAAMR